jgi:hypothetical protein
MLIQINPVSESRLASLRLAILRTPALRSFYKIPKTWSSGRDLQSSLKMLNSCDYCKSKNLRCESCNPAFKPFTRAVCITCWGRDQQCMRTEHRLPASSFEFSHGNDIDKGGVTERDFVKYFYQEDPYECKSAWAPLYVRKQLQTR